MFKPRLSLPARSIRATGISTSHQARHSRSFSWSRRCLASQVPLPPSSDDPPPLLEKIRRNPQVLKSIQEFVLGMKDYGIDPQKGPPSKLQMLKLMTNSEFRQRTMKVMEELQKAGIELKPEDAVQLMQLRDSLKKHDR